MSLWRQLTRGMRGLFSQSRANDDIAAEIRQYLDDATAAGLARGLSIDEASARRARRTRQPGRRSGTSPLLRMGKRGPQPPLRSAIRRAATAQQRRFHHRLRHHSRARHRRQHGHLQRRQSHPVFAPALSASQPHPDDLEHLARRAFRALLRHLSRTSRAQPLVRVDGNIRSRGMGNPPRRQLSPERLEGQSVSASFFRVLGVVAESGRDFLPSEEASTAPKLRSSAIALAASFSARSRHHRPRHQARWRQLHRHRRHAAARSKMFSRPPRRSGRRRNTI